MNTGSGRTKGYLLNIVDFLSVFGIIVEAQGR